MGKLMLLAHVRQCIELVERQACEFETRLRALPALCAALELHLDQAALEAALAACVQLTLPDLPPPLAPDDQPPPMTATPAERGAPNGLADSATPARGLAPGVPELVLSACIAAERTGNGGERPSDRVDGCSASSSHSTVSSVSSACPLSSSSDLVLASASLSEQRSQTASEGISVGSELTLADTLRSLDRAQQRLLDDEARLKAAVAADTETATASVAARSSTSPECVATDSLSPNSTNSNASATSVPDWDPDGDGDGERCAKETDAAESAHEQSNAAAGGGTVPDAAGAQREENAAKAAVLEPTDEGDAAVMNEPGSNDLEASESETGTEVENNERRSCRAASVKDTGGSGSGSGGGGGVANADADASAGASATGSAEAAASGASAGQSESGALPLSSLEGEGEGVALAALALEPSSSVLLPTDAADSLLRELTALLQTPAGGLGRLPSNAPAPSPPPPAAQGAAPILSLFVMT